MTRLSLAKSQILPAFIVELDIESCGREFDKWSRALPLPVTGSAFKIDEGEEVPLLSPTGATNDSFIDVVEANEEEYPYVAFDI